MLGKRATEAERPEVDPPHLAHVGRDTFYGFLAAQREQLFRDEDFAALYCADNGRPSVPPSLLATALLLQTHDCVSDQEAKARADFDLRWKVALGVSLEARPFAKSTLQLFRARLIEQEQVRAIFQRSLAFARQIGHLTRRQVTLALDTSPIHGRGAVKDTYNLLADGIVQLLRVLAARTGERPDEWAGARELGRYCGTSLKGGAAIDWDDPAARRAFLRSLVADADRLLDDARQVLADLAADEPEPAGVREAADLLAQLLNQDIERRDDGATLREGVSPDRVVAVHDPEMRHGRKSAAKRFDGHKGAIAVDTTSQLILAAAVLPGNAQDHEEALALVKQAEENAGIVAATTVADCAYGDGETRQAFAAAGRALVAKVPQRRGQAHFPKDDFLIDLDAMTCTCPAGQECRTVAAIGSGRRYGTPGVALRGFRFDAATCDACPLRPSCVRARPGRGRLVMLHPREALLQAARAFQRGPAFAPYRRLRQVAEHRLARLMQLGVRQARYIGRTKTLFQPLLAATVANLTLVATAAGLMRGRRRRPATADALAWTTRAVLLVICHLLVAHKPPARRHSHRLSMGFRPRF
ncbi:MAG TPA: IS1182 family transposase [Solirubrobacteraceae bacterium]|nr:IS1182 family transposase [Solirubrobacteraceae bacterium]